MVEDIKGKGFEAAFVDAKKYYHDAYGVPKLSQSGFTNHLIKVYYLSSLNYQIGIDTLGDLIESLQPKSETRKLIEILYSIITKECKGSYLFDPLGKLAEVSSVLEVDEELQKLLFFSATHSYTRKENVSTMTIHNDFTYVANEIKLWKSRDDIQLLFDFYIVKNNSKNLDCFNNRCPPKTGL